MKKMNKTFLAGTAFAVSTAAALSLSGCCCVPAPQPSVYGPPEYFEAPPTEEIETDFTVETEILEDVYGPPEWFE